MASTSLYICTMLLMTALVLASATGDYGYSYTPTPQAKQPKPDDQKENYYGQEPKPNPDDQKEKYNGHEEPKPKPDDQKEKCNGEEPKPKPDDHKEKYNGQEPKPEGKEKPLDFPNIFDVEGLVLCKSGSKYFPIQGAVARISCEGVDEEGNKRRDFYTLSGESNEKGYFFATVKHSQIEKNWKLNNCKVFLDKQHLDTKCNVPVDVNKAITGVALDSINYRILHNNINLYSVGPFFCTPSELPSLPHNGGY